MSLTATPAAGSSAPGPGARRLETAAFVAMAILVGVFYLWSALQPANSWTVLTRSPQGYYPLETAGFRSGHLYAAITPHPALLALPDPYDPVANAPYRVHDMTLFKGHYYIYFGVTPVLILFWPVAALTGRYLTEPFAVAFFCSAAIWVGMGLLLAIRRRHFPGAPTAALVLGWVCLAWATPLNLLVEGPQFYQVPISCAILLQALMLAALYRGLHSESRALAWLFGAGLLFGLSIGARPNYLACSAVLLIPVVAYGRASGVGGGLRIRAYLKAFLAAFVPAAACGIGLLIFNFARFGSVSEFGIHYQLGGERFMNLKPMSVGFLLPHVAYYLFNPGTWQSYYPFFAAPAGQPYGLLRYLPWAWLALLAFLRPGPGEPGERAGRLQIVWALAGAFILNLAFLSCFFGTTARYPGDFAHAGLIVAGVGALALGQRAERAGRRTIVGAGAATLALVSLFFASAVFIGWFPKRDTFLVLARAANWPAYAWQRAHGAAFGGLRLELLLPEHPPNLAEPLFETGMQSDQRDWLQIEYLPSGRARLSFFHAGTGLFSGREFAVPGDRKVTIEARCGSLMPPFSHPLFSEWSRPEFDAARRDLQLTVNGTEVLRAALECYESSPSNLTIGRLAWFTGGMQQAFSGRVLGVERLQLVKPPKAAPLFTKAAPLEMTLFFPAVKSAGSDPLLLTGSGTRSDLLFCSYDGANHVSFGMDHFGAGGPQSESVPYDPLVPHTIVAWMGSLAGGSPSGAPPDRLVVIFDGRVVMNFDQLFYPSSPESMILGFNANGSTAAGREFTGRFASVRQVGLDALPVVNRNGAYGAVEMSVDLPFGVLGTQEPLVVSGATGAGDLVYVRYVDSNHIAFGFDHWGIGGTLGKPVAVDYGKTHRIAVTFQSLYPPGSASRKSDRVSASLDGRTVLEARWACYPSPSDRIKVGENPIGASTCGPRFTGRILSVERFPEPRQ